MGNLSCVSCKVKEKKITQSIGELALGDFKGAAFNQDAVCTAADKNATLGNEDSQTGSRSRLRGLSDKGGPRPDSTELRVGSQTTARELYDVLKSSRLHDDEEDEHLDDVEKAAKAIVDMSVFLTTQVIYPAYLRYLQEDHPEAYIQYCERPRTLLPAATNAITVGGEVR